MLDVVAFAALIKRKRGEAGLSQLKLANKIWNDPGRKADISRLENARIANPQEQTIQYLCTALNISATEMEPIRQSRPHAARLKDIPTLDREALQNLAARFGIENAFDATDAELRKLLSFKADEHRALIKEIESLKGLSARFDNIHAAALDAAKNEDYAEANQLIEDALEIHASEVLRPALETNAKLLETQADIALLRGDTEQAFTLLSTAADSFATVDAMEPARRRILRYFKQLYEHGLRYGGDGMALSEKMIRNALSRIDKKENALLWADAQNNLAIALQTQGTRTDGEAGATLLAEAVTAYRAALEVYTRAKHPVDWAMTQNNLAIALRTQGTRTYGDKGATLLAEAVTAYRAALEVRTRAEHPADWAGTQNNLAVALRNQGTRTDGEKGATLLAEAVTAYRAALEVYTRAEHPEDWAATHNNLANALQKQGARTDREARTALLAEAVTAYRAALTVRTRAAHPVDWAMTQNNLAGALHTQGTRTDGEEGAALLAEAVTACRDALEVRTRAEYPVDWAGTQGNLARCQAALSGNTTCADPKAALTDALASVDAALTVFDPEHMSYNHATATRLRDGILARLDALA